MRPSAIIILVYLLTYASVTRALDCNDYFGLNICAGNFELGDDKVTYFEQNKSMLNTDLKKKRAAI